MKGFYTKEEAAQILGVSVRQVSNYLAQAKLSKVYQGRRVWIPQEDVQQLYDKASRGSRIRPEDVHELQDRVDRVEQAVETLKLGLGVGSRRPTRSQSDLVALRQRMIHALGRKHWSRRAMYDHTDELMTVQAEEIADLAVAVGPTAWVPFVDLAQRMLVYVEGNAEYPDKGLDIIHTKLLRARDRFYGLIYAATKTETALPPHLAERTFQSIHIPVTSIDKHVVGYLLSK
jgi:hypothetical protein